MFNREEWKKEYDSKYYEDNKEKIQQRKKEYMVLYREKNKEKIKQARSVYIKKTQKKATANSHQWRQRNPVTTLLMRSKQSAHRRNLEHTITLEDIVIPEFCPYLGIKLTNIIGQGRLPSNMSIDRIDNSKGYIKGNVQIISNQANVMKNSASLTELTTFATNVLTIHGTPTLVCPELSLSETNSCVKGRLSCIMQPPAIPD